MICLEFNHSHLPLLVNKNEKHFNAKMKHCQAITGLKLTSSHWFDSQPFDIVISKSLHYKVSKVIKFAY